MRHLALALFVAVLFSSAVLLAQDAGGDDHSGMVILGSISAIVIAAIALTRVVVNLVTHLAQVTSPKLAANIGWFLSRLPIWMFVIANSALLTFLANRVFHTIDGDLLSLMWTAIQNAATASGFYEWYWSLTKPMAASAQARDISEK